MAPSASWALRASAALGLALFISSSPGCGKKADPVPPAPKASQAPAAPQAQEEPQAEKKSPPEVETRRRMQPLPPP